MHPMLNIAVRAARNAGKIIARAFEEVDAIEVSEKSRNDFVTNIDKQAEEAIIETIKKSYPDHVIFSEEIGEVEGSNNEYQWIVDPLDGTTNFLKGIPHFAVSIALKVKGKIEHAVVFDPIRNEVFTASRGNGAQLNDYRIRVSQSKDLNGTVLATGFPFKYKQHVDAYMNIFSDLFAYTADMRRAGSAALDMAYVAAGRLDGFWEIGLKPWDIAAGELLVKEAGGLTCDFAGGANHMASGNTVSANPKVAKHLVQTMRPHISGVLAQ